MAANDPEVLLTKSQIEKQGPGRLAAITFVLQSVVAYFLIPFVFSGQSKNVQWALMAVWVIATTGQQYWAMNSLYKSVSKKRAVKVAEARRLQGIMNRGPQTEGYADAVQRLNDPSEWQY